MKFELGDLYTTNAVAEKADNDLDFSEFMINAFYDQYCECDWGDTCEEDAKQNNDAIKNGERILAVYKYDDDITIWIITEADRSRTTILFPEDY